MKYLKSFEHATNVDLARIAVEIFWGNLDVKKYISDRDIDVNYQDSEGKTLLYHIIETDMPTQRAFDIIKELIDIGADLSIEDNNGKDFLSYMSHNDPHYLEELCGIYPKNFEDFIMRRDARKYNL